MQPIVRDVLVVAKSGDDRALNMADELSSFLAALGCTCRMAINQTDVEGCLGSSSLLDIGACPQLAIVLGGDGTMLSVARKLMGESIPLLGINLGRLGFLTQLSAHDWREVMADVVVKGFAVHQILVLRCEVARQGRQVFLCGAVNDVVVSRGAMARLVRLEVSYAGERIGSFRADGMVVSTPTGATAYSMSAGGPLVHPDLQTMTLTPICPFLCDLRPMVFPTDRPLDLQVQESSSEVMLTCDGQAMFPLQAGDWVRVRRGERQLKLVSVGGYSYIRKLQEKGFIRDR